MSLNRLFGRKANGAAGAGAGAGAGSSSPPVAASAPGLPAVLAADPTYAEAIQLLNTAIQCDDSGDSRRASEHYEAGLSMLLSVLKRMPVGGDKEWLRNLISTQMSKAENLKSRISGRRDGGQAPGIVRAHSGPHAAAAAQQRHSSSASAHARAGASSSASPASPSIDPSLRSAIESEILRPGGHVTFQNIIGLDDAKAALREMVILPSLRPDLFSGVRAPPRGLLLYGPPGNGKSFLAAAVASESGATFFSVSAATLVSKHLGEGERLVRALFAVARERAPSIIFIDEIDSIMSRRSSEEHEASRRLKTEFFIQFDGVSSGGAVSAPGSPPAPHVCVLAATNIPEELDEALVRRLSRRIYIPVPSADARMALLRSLLSQPSLKHSLDARAMQELVAATQGYSNSDLTALVSDAALAPLRSLSPDALLRTPADALPPVRMEHFQQALARVRPSVSAERLAAYKAWSDKQEAAR